MSSGFTIRPIQSDSRRTPSVFRRNTQTSTGGLGGVLRTVAIFPLTFFGWLRRRQQTLGWRKFFAIGFVGFLGIIGFYVIFLWLTLPSISEQTILAASQSTVITDRNGVELYRIFGEQDRTMVPGSEIPDMTKKALIAIEDRRYFERGCIDVRALARAVLSFGRSGGASTITRQLARNALDLQREYLLNRKIKEFILGCQLEGKYSKEDLLNLYLNWIPFGQNAYGVEQASGRFFGKHAKELTLAQSAVLASLPQRPSYFSPYGRHVHTDVSDALRTKILDGTITSTDQIRDGDVIIGLLGVTIGSGSTQGRPAGSPEKKESTPNPSPKSLYVGGRADQVLRSMQDAGFIDDAVRKAAEGELKTMTFKQVRENIRAPHFVLWAKDQVENLFANSSEKGLLEQGGLTIQTTLDWKLQEAAEQVIAAHKDDVKKRFMASNVALVAVDPATREILAYVGNTDYLAETSEGKIDMAQVPRQPGSSFKPFVYASAFGNGYGPATVLYDVPTKFGDYAPQNFEGSFWGLMSARRALGGSRNIPAVKTYFLGGQERDILDLVERMGIPSPKAHMPEKGYGSSLAIGTAEVPLIEMVQGYATLADGGMVRPISGIIKVTDNRGSLILSTSENSAAVPGRDGEPVMDPRIAYEVTSILSDPGARPNEYWKSILSVPGTQAAAKTGTSNKCLEREEKPGVDPNIAPCKKRRPDNVWTIGYTPTLVAGVWAGNATSEPLSEKADGLTVAAPIWKEFMVKAQKILKPTVTVFTIPDGIVQAQISLLSGELPTECTPVGLRRSDIFLAENAPTKDDPACVQVEVDKVTGLLASESCPAEAREMRSFLVPYNAAGRDFPQWDTDVQKWAAAQAMENPRAGSGLTLFLAGSGGVLPLPLAPTQKCDIALTPGRTVKPTLTLVSPGQNGTANYPSFAPKIQYTVGSRLHSIEYAIDGKVLATVMSAPWMPALRVPKSIEKTGTHTFSVTLTDLYYNTVSAEAQMTFSADSSGPDLRLTSPENGAEFAAGSSLSMRAESADADGSVKYVEFFIDEQLIVRKPIAPYELAYPLNVTPGPHTVRAVATDLSGNTTEDSVMITVK